MILNYVELHIEHSEYDIETKCKIIKAKDPLTKDDISLISYAFNEDLPQENIEVKINTVDDVTIDGSIPVEFVIVEKFNGVLTISEYNLPMSDFNESSISKKIMSSRSVSLFDERIMLEDNDSIDNYLFGIDVTKAKMANNKNDLLTHSESYSDYMSDSFISKHHLSFLDAAVGVVRCYDKKSPNEYTDITIAIFYNVKKVAFIDRSRVSITDKMKCNSKLYDYELNLIDTDKSEYN